MRPFWLKTIALLLAIWLCAGAAIFFARQSKVTPESLLGYVEKHDLASRGEGERAKTLEKVASQLNQLTYDERREIRLGRKLDGFFRALTAEEQARFLDLTLPTGFKQMMESLNKMEAEKRCKFVENALKQMQQDEEAPGAESLDENAKKIIEQGFKSFYSEASAEVKMDVAPLIEQLQRNLQR